MEPDPVRELISELGPAVGGGGGGAAAVAGGGGGGDSDGGDGSSLTRTTYVRAWVLGEGREPLRPASAMALSMSVGRRKPEATWSLRLLERRWARSRTIGGGLSAAGVWIWVWV